MEKRHHPADAIRSGRPMLRPERKRGMVLVFLPSESFAIKRGLRKAMRASRIPGRVNHGVAPLARWWWAGFRRDPAAWAWMRRWRGSSGIVGRRMPRHEMRREAMRLGWDNHAANLAEREVSAYDPRPAEFHLIGMRSWLRMKENAAQRNRGLKAGPWPGPCFRRGTGK